MAREATANVQSHPAQRPSRLSYSSLVTPGLCARNRGRRELKNKTKNMTAKHPIKIIIALLALTVPVLAQSKPIKQKVKIDGVSYIVTSKLMVHTYSKPGKSALGVGEAMTIEEIESILNSKRGLKWFRAPNDMRGYVWKTEDGWIAIYSTFYKQLTIQ